MGTFFKKNLLQYNNTQSIRFRLRSKRLAPVLKCIENFSKKYGFVKIIDIGGTEQYWKLVSKDFIKKNNIKFTIVNVPGIKLPENHDRFRFICADGCDLSNFKDNSFHIAHSNSVIEHVGDWEKMVQFSNEIKRVALKYYIQTPNYWFPIEPHCMTPFFHWLPKPIRIKLLMSFSLGHWQKANSVDSAVRTIESARLLNKKMFQELFKKAEIKAEKFAFINKSYTAMN